MGGHNKALLKSYLCDENNLYNLATFRNYTLKGVLQSSILGPLPFFLYINDMWNIPLTQGILLYGDFTGSNLYELEFTSNNWLVELSNWLSANKLPLNINETKISYFQS